MRFLTSVFLTSTFLASGTLLTNAAPNVVTSIKPVHSLVAAIMGEVGTPDLIVEGAASPHTYALKPSQAVKLENADLIFWIGRDIEAFLEKPLGAIAKDAKAIELLNAHDLVKLKFREGGAFDEHDHDDHAEDKHDDHAHDEHKHEEHAEDKHDDHAHDEHKHEEHAEDKHDDHAHDEHKHDEHAEDKHDDHGHDEHAHGDYDPHVWLDPANAKALAHEIEEALSKMDPENAKTYEENTKNLMARLDDLVKEVSTQLQPVQGKGFVVFHDAYQYFEKRFGMSAVGSITVSPEVLPGAERVAELQAKVKASKANCVFSEPQFKPKLVTVVTEGTNAKSGVLDPLGANIEAGPEHYFSLIRDMATSFKTCLSE